MNDKITLSIFTPTYNRVNLLEKAYNSLIEQTNKNFKWLIVDDGSTDSTEKKVKEWIDESKIKIEYYKKDNGGKHSAMNYAFKVVDTELILLCLDSDDYLTKNAVDIILKKWNSHDSNEKGIVMLCDDENRTNKYTIKFNERKLAKCSVSEALSKNYFNASAIYIVSSDYIKNFEFPEIENEKFFTEAYLLYQMEEPFIWTKERICIREYQQGGLTKNIGKLFIKSPKSWFLYNKLRMQKSKSIIYKIKYTIYYITFGIISKQKKIIIDSNNKLLVILLFPLGFFGTLYLKKSLIKKK